MQNKHRSTTAEKSNAVEVMLTISAPLPNKDDVVPSICNCAAVLGVPYSTLECIERNLIEKHQKLTASKKGVYFAFVNKKKGYSTNQQRILLVVAFNNHPHVVCRYRFS